jgi:hypothetical protein
MNKSIKKLVIILVICLVSAIQTSSVNAQFEPGGTGEGGQQVICRGYRDWSTFISATISYDGFVEYWKDILVRYNTNICLYEDIDSLFNRIKKVRKQIRSAFYACEDPNKVDRLRNTYYELETMLFFLRNYIDTGNGQFIVRNDQTVINELRDFYVFNSGIFSEEKVLELYDTFKARYGARMKTYENCSDSSWGMVVDKWNEFKETAGGVAPALSKAKESAENRWAKLKQTSANFGEEFIDGIVAVKINGLSPEEGLTQIWEELKKNFPSGVTIEQLHAAKQLSDQKRNYEILEDDYEGQYFILYKESSDELTRLVEERLKTLNLIIETTFNPQHQTIHCVKDINDHQCP